MRNVPRKGGGDVSNFTTAGQVTELSRRALLGVAAVIPVILTAPAAAAAEPMADRGMGGNANPHPHPTPGLEGVETLNVNEMEALEAFCSRLVPSEEHRPGAKEARAAHYIDHALAGPLMKQRTTYAAGLSALDAYARSVKGQPFAQLVAADQDSVLHDLEAGKASGFTSGSAAFFGLVRSHTIEGMFCDPYYGGNANFVGWDLIGYPGLRMMVRPEDQRLVKPKTLRQSAYSANMFGLGDGG
jgi:gluconate 2-dehydrogenase gamma chain